MDMGYLHSLVWGGLATDLPVGLREHIHEVCALVPNTSNFPRLGGFHLRLKISQEQSLNIVFNIPCILGHAKWLEWLKYHDSPRKVKLIVSGPSAKLQL